jgi:hypothetical protein
MSREIYLVLFAALSIGCGLFFIFLFTRETNRSELIDRMKEHHENISSREQQERLAMLYAAGNHATGSPEYLYYMDCHKQLEKVHQARWKERVAEIVNIEVRISEAEQDELDRGADWRKAVKK